MASDLVTRSATELLDILNAGEASAVEVTRAHLDRIHETDDRVHAFLRTLDDTALAHADDVDRRRAAGEAVGALAGVPLALKDILCTRGQETTCASRILEHYRPPYDATVVEKLRAADAIVVGKTNMDEFAMGSSTENSAFGTSANPWDLQRVPGGSSGGTSAAVAAFDAPLGIGTDTGGSIRQPAALCGLVGMKPTYGLVSRYGLIAFASSLDQVGPLSRTVTDAAHLFTAIAGHDPRDATSIPGAAPEVLSGLETGIEGLRIGVVREFLQADTGGVEPGVRARVEEAVARLEALGATTVEVSLPHAGYGVAAYYLIAPSEASSNLSRYDGVRYGYRAPEYSDLTEMYEKSRAQGFGAEVKRRIMIGTYVLSHGYYDAYYLQAQKIRRLIAQDFDDAFKQCDVIMGPTSPSTAFNLGEKGDDPVQMYLSDIYTIAVNLAGLPGMSIPAGFGSNGRPVGLQIIGNYFAEARMLNVAHQYQQATDHHDRVPQDIGL